MLLIIAVAMLLHWQWTNCFVMLEFSLTVKFAMTTSLKYCSHLCPTI